MKILLFLAIFFLTSCGGVDFVYKNSTNLNNPAYNKTLVSFSGVKLPHLYRYSSQYFGKNKNYSYDLFVEISESKIKRSVQKNQAISKLDYELNFYYEFFSLAKQCIVYEKNIISKFSFEPKSSGYNFGSDQSLEMLYKLAIKTNLQQFIGSIAYQEGFDCVNES